MNYTVQELALQYAEKLIAFYEAKNSDQADRSHVLRANDELHNALIALSQACAKYPARAGKTYVHIEA